MKKLLAFLAGTVVITTPVVADCCDMSGHWDVGAHALLYSPITCPFDFATRTVQNGGLGSLSVASIKCELDWGFRVFGRYETGCTIAGVSYQWFESSHSQQVTGFPIIRNIPPNVAAIRGEGSTRLQYQNVDASAGRYLYRSCDWGFYLFGNIRWIDLSYVRETRALTAQGFAYRSTEKSRLEGAGIGIGLGTSYDLWCNIGFFGHANIVGVIAERSTPNVVGNQQVTAQEQPPRLRAKYSADTCVTPEANFHLGLNYTLACGCWTFAAELGYELDYFWDAFSFPQGDINTDTNRFRTCEDIGFSGLFFGGRLIF